MTTGSVEDSGAGMGIAGPIDERKITTSEARRGQAREAILEAAWVVLARDGYEKITTRRIAKVAGVNIATLHYYFGTKEQLLSEATRYALKDAENRLQQAMIGTPTAVAALERVFEAVWQLVQERPGILRFDLVVRGFRDEAARREAIGIYDSYRTLTEDLITRHLQEGGTLAPGITVPGLAHYLICAVDGVLLQHVLTSDAAAARSALTMLMEHALSLLNAR
ncbi:MAG: TetR/AcrR family transcriptional regulator [Cytophagales bacterium]|nr:TetR/AcrR family transcriptional regulator [Armatimonadota bacterium]